jgi:hypothetical protein
MQQKYYQLTFHKNCVFVLNNARVSPLFSIRFVRSTHSNFSGLISKIECVTHEWQEKNNSVFGINSSLPSCQLTVPCRGIRKSWGETWEPAFKGIINS